FGCSLISRFSASTDTAHAGPGNAEDRGGEGICKSKKGSLFRLLRACVAICRADCYATNMAPVPCPAILIARFIGGWEILLLLAVALILMGAWYLFFRK